MAGSTWVRLDVGYFTNPKVLRAGRDAAVLHLAAICYLGAHELDHGVLPAEAVDILGQSIQHRQPRTLVARLVDAGLWHPDDAGWLIHHYDLMNGENSEAAAARVRQRRKRERDRGRLDQWLEQRQGGADEP